MMEQRFTTRKKQLLFRLRSRTLDVKLNLRDQHTNHWCISCGLFPETQSHLLQCPELVKNLHILTEKPSQLNENFVYGNLTQQETIVNIYSELLDIRENLKQMWATNFNRCVRKFTTDDFPLHEGPLHHVHDVHLLVGDPSGPVMLLY